jgi:hypothetical protein
VGFPVATPCLNLYLIGLTLIIKFVIFIDPNQTKSYFVSVFMALFNKFYLISGFINIGYSKLICNFHYFSSVCFDLALLIFN